KNALLAILLLAPMLGLIGTMIVNNRMAFFSDAIGHSTFTGLAIGTILGISNLSLSAIIFSIIFAILITIFKYKSLTPTDTLISVFASIAAAFGVVILSSGGNFSKYSAFLIGDILSITNQDLILLLITVVTIFLIWPLIFNKLFLLSLNYSLAKSKNINVIFYELLFTIVIAIVITISIRWVGILLINSLIVLPAAATRTISKNMKDYHLYSILVALFSGVVGLLISYYVDISTGATIVLVAGFLYLSILIFQKFLRYFF
ncbi:MAG: metal ABC transporter permease, partial [Oligoflexia bacterium]|nr:metal ABC transporter permease [Oligoflexia bacterium]